MMSHYYIYTLRFSPIELYSLTIPLFIAVLISNQESKRLCICVVGVSVSRLSLTIVILYFDTVSTLWIFFWFSYYYFPLHVNFIYISEQGLVTVTTTKHVINIITRKIDISMIVDGIGLPVFSTRQLTLCFLIISLVPLT